MANRRLPQPRKYRGRWHAQVTLKNGARPAKNFESFAEAKAWITDMLANQDSEHEPELGGPKQATLAEALRLYAKTYSLVKGGCDAELTRINHYLVGAGMKRIRRGVDAEGKAVIEDYELKIGAKAFAEHRDKRLAKRRATYEAIAELGRKRCSMLKPMDFRTLMTTMKSDGLKDSTIQKEIALLRHMFRLVPEEWNWKGFEDPTRTLKLGRSNSRFVFLTAAQEKRLWAALDECDRPEYIGLVAICMETTMRKGSLLKWRWEKTDLENRIIKVPSKSGDVVLPLSQHACNILANMPRPEAGLVFPFKSNAVQEMWKGVRKKAGLPELQFRDLRHLGATAWARRGLNAHQLMKVLGHKTLTQAQTYINLVNEDMLDAMDEAAAASPVVSVSIPAVEEDGDKTVKRRRSQRLAEAVLRKKKALAEQRAAAETKPASGECVEPAPASAADVVAAQWQKEDEEAKAADSAAEGKPAPAPVQDAPMVDEATAAQPEAQVVHLPSAQVIPFLPRKRA